MTHLPIERDTTALLLIDLQVGITGGMTTEPHSTDTIVGNARRLVDACRAASMPVIFVRVNYGQDNALQVRVPHEWNVDFAPPAGWDEIDPRLGATDDDIVVIKHATSAFYETDLDLQLRQRGIRNLILSGITTHTGVESTSRSAYDRAYTQVFAHDAMGAVNTAQHEHSLTQIFPLMGHTASTDDIVAAIESL